MMKYKLMRKADHANLIHVQINRDRHVKTRQVSPVLGLANVRCIKSKDVWIKQILVEEDIGLCVLTIPGLTVTTYHGLTARIEITMVIEWTTLFEITENEVEVWKIHVDIGGE